MPHPLPVMLIHGFNGSPEGWELSGFRDALLAAGLDGELVRRFHYGWAASGHYDNQGDIRRIAARLVRGESDDPEALDSQLARLSEASVARGGPREVAIVAHSMGGLIARYYLSRSEPDEFGTINEGLVSRLITIGSPHHGLDFARIVELLPRDALLWRLLDWVERLPIFEPNASVELRALAAQVRRAQYLEREALVAVPAPRAAPAASGYGSSEAVRQLIPGSALLRELGAPGAFPPGVTATVIWGEVRVAVTLRRGPFALWRRLISLGDLLVPAASASSIPHVEATLHELNWERGFQIELGVPAMLPFDLADFLPPVAHSNLLVNPEVHRLVLAALGVG